MLDSFQEGICSAPTISGRYCHRLLGTRPNRGVSSDILSYTTGAKAPRTRPIASRAGASGPRVWHRWAGSSGRWFRRLPSAAYRPALVNHRRPRCGQERAREVRLEPDVSGEGLDDFLGAVAAGHIECMEKRGRGSSSKARQFKAEMRLRHSCWPKQAAGMPCTETTPCPSCADCSGVAVAGWATPHLLSSVRLFPEPLSTFSPAERLRHVPSRSRPACSSPTWLLPCSSFAVNLGNSVDNASSFPNPCPSRRGPRHPSGGYCVLDLGGLSTAWCSMVAARRSRAWREGVWSRAWRAGVWSRAWREGFWSRR